MTEKRERFSIILEDINGVTVPLELDGNGALKNALRARNSRDVDVALKNTTPKSNQPNRLSAIELVKNQLRETDWYKPS